VQWEYQVGPSVGIEAGDHIWISRYILEVPQTIIKDYPYLFVLFLFFSLIITAYFTSPAAYYSKAFMIVHSNIL
jgi:hypothetical protein